MAKRLLERQASLLAHLTSGGAIFGGKDGTAIDPALHGIDRGLLHIEARFSHEKRMDKIASVFPRTFELLGEALQSTVRAFAHACPPTDISRLANARQFHAFLSARWRDDPPNPPYLNDVAACELACASARTASEDRASDPDEQAAPSAGIRRHPNVVLLRAAYDVRPMLDQDPSTVPVQRDTRLAVALAPAADQPGIFELAPAVFELLTALETWTDPAAFGHSPDAGELIAELAQAGLLDVRR